MKLTTSTIGPRRVLNLDGRFDFASHRVFRDAVKEALADKHVQEIQVNLAKVDYVDSSALGMLLLSRENCAAADKKICLAYATGTVKDVLRIANFQQLFDIE